MVDVSVVFMAPYLPDSTNEAALSLIPSRTTWCIPSNTSEGVDFCDNWIIFQLLKAPNPVTKCTYWLVLGSFKDCNIILLLHKSTSFDAFDGIHQVVLVGIRDNMASLVESGNYGAINKTDIATNLFYVIVLTSESYTLQDNTTIDVKIITARELVFKAQYLCFMHLDTNLYWNQHPQHHVVTFPTCTILHPRLEVIAVTKKCM